MKLNQGVIIKMKAEDFNEFKFKWLKVVTKNEHEVAREIGKEFVGYISGLYLASNPPHLPTHINFVSKNSTSSIKKNVSQSLVHNIMVFDLDYIELL